MAIKNISLHIKHIFEENELKEDSVVKYYLTTAADGEEERFVCWRNLRTSPRKGNCFLKVNFIVKFSQIGKNCVSLSHEDIKNI